MNKKIFLRGLGIGLILGGLVMFVALGTDKSSGNNSAKKTLTVSATNASTADEDEQKGQEEKKSEAENNKKEGNKEEKTEEDSEDDSKQNHTKTDDSDKKESGSEAATKNDVTENPTTEKAEAENATTEKSTEEPSTEKTTKEATTEKSTEKATTEEPTTEEPTTEELKPAAVKYESGGGYIVVTKDMDPETICDELLEIGVISDKWDYYNWLLQSGYSNSIEPGTYYFGGYESYAGIVWILLGN